jgi:NADPH-dependent glutamate synthase beta subunit-like oxidoreductase
MNIPRFLQLFKEGRLEDAFESVILDNPLPASTGRVCQHPCDNRCRRQTVDDAVNMREVHRFIADSIYGSDHFEGTIERIRQRKLAPTSHKIAIAGAGPTGLTAAFYLALLGHSVTVFDSKQDAGGMLRYALPEYRLPKAVLDREIEFIRRMGVEFVFNNQVGSQLPLNELDGSFDAVFISIGTWKESWVYLPGTELKGVYPALTFLEHVANGEPLHIGRRVAVIGGGNAAIDSARTALRLGADVTVIYRRERKDMPAIAEEVRAAEQEGAHYAFLASPHRIVGDAQGNVRAIEVVKTRLGEYDSSGRRKPVSTGEVMRFECDCVILAVGETVDLDFCRASGMALNEGGTIVVDRYTLETSRPRFYAGGDAISGASNVSNAMGYGKNAARAIDQRLTGFDRFAGLFPALQYEQAVPEHPSNNRRHHPHELPASLRVHGSEEVVTGLTTHEAVDEACRCLRCDVKV